MGLHSTVGNFPFFLGLFGICRGFVWENCTNYGLQFNRIHSVPGEVAMLNSSLVALDVFDFTSVPYNMSWVHQETGREITSQPGRVLVLRETLWFLNVSLDDDGDYVSILRTPSRCYSKAMKLIVKQTVIGEFGRPWKARQVLTLGVPDTLSCPLREYIKKLDSYNIASSLQWFKVGDPIVDGTDGYTYRDTYKLSINRVTHQHNTDFTCTLTFTLGGVTGAVSETINAYVDERYTLTPQVHEPGNEIIRAEMGSNFTKRCLVFVPCVGNPLVTVIWMMGGYPIFNTDPSLVIYTSEQRQWRQEAPHKGFWFERLLMFTELREKDFHINFTCRAFSDRGLPEAYFSLMPPEPNIMIPIGSLLGGVMFLFIISVIIYYIFKVDIVLWFRKAFPVLYTNKDSDGKLFDAYVAYPQPSAAGYSQEVELFALHTLPLVLETACGYKLFIAGRDCLPGKAIIDSIEENIQASRRLLLLYTASTFTSKPSSSNNNNNISKGDESVDDGIVKTKDDCGSDSFDSSEEELTDNRQQLECVVGMHRTLLERSLKVVLVELEEISQAQMALLPESVRHLRKKQGAVCLWKNKKKKKEKMMQQWTTCTQRREVEEKSGQDSRLSPSLSPSNRFWKEMRYHMPVRGKRTVYPEKTALLNL